MRAFLTKAQAVTESTAAKEEVGSGARDFEARTLQDIPAEYAPNYDLKIPAAHSFPMFACEIDEFSASAFVALADDDFVEV
jgi:hypothetical protein